MMLWWLETDVQGETDGYRQVIMPSGPRSSLLDDHMRWYSMAGKTDHSTSCCPVVELEQWEHSWVSDDTNNARGRNLTLRSDEIFVVMLYMTLYHIVRHCIWWRQSESEGGTWWHMISDDLHRWEVIGWKYDVVTTVECQRESMVYQSQAKLI